MPLNYLLPEASLKDVIGERRRANAQRGANHDGEEGHGEEGDSEEGDGSSLLSARKDGCASGATPSRRVTTLTAPGRSGDLIVIDSPQVGSPPREGVVLEVIRGEVRVSYRLRWADGHQTLIAPKSGSARIVRASNRA